eukprot:2838634-Amphidinium_carterae.1
MHRTARLQNVLVTEPVIVEVADLLLARGCASGPLVRGGLRELHKKEGIGVDNSPFTLGTLRGGGVPSDTRLSIHCVVALVWPLDDRTFSAALPPSGTRGFCHGQCSSRSEDEYTCPCEFGADDSPSSLQWTSSCDFRRRCLAGWCGWPS